MTEAQLEALGPALATFMERWVLHCRYAPTFEHLRTYMRGLLSDLERKSVEPIARAAGTPVRTLQEFLRDHQWSHTAVRDDLHGCVGQLLPTLPTDELGNVGLIDETSALKKGDKTPGVARQYLGCVGKVANGIVTVHLGVSRGTYKALLDADLYLPKQWSEDRPRCRAAGIPDDLVHRPKWQIALEQLKRARQHGLTLDWLTFDCEYGRCPGLLEALDALPQRFVGDVPGAFACRLAGKPQVPPAPGLTGQRAEVVVRQTHAFRDQAWRIVRLSRATAEDQLWRVKGARVWVSSASGWLSGTYWLVWACSESTGEEKFLISNAPVECALEVLVRVAFRRAHVEHAFRICKSELGFTHFEGRNYQALMRHMSLCVATLVFVAEHTQRLRGEKSPGDGRAGVPRSGGAQHRMAGAQPRHQPPDMDVGSGHLSPAPQSRGHRVQKTADRDTTQTQKTKKT
jgi:SRSO17 transposase